jgi:peroxiredoxin
MPQTDALVVALEPATIKEIALDATLRELLKIIADEVRSLSTLFAEAVDAFVGRLQATEAGALAPVVGDTLQDFVLPGLNSGLVSRGEILRAGPAVIAFLRGHWRPYCHTMAAALGEIADAAAAQGLHSIAIAPENRKFAQGLTRDSGEHVLILAAGDNGYAKALNLAIRFDDDMAEFASRRRGEVR